MSRRRKLGPRGPWGGAGGFTLLELLLAVTILAVVAALLMGAFRVGYRAWEKGEAVMESLQRLRGGLERVRRQLAAAVAVPPAEDAAPPAGFQGSDRTLRFVAAHSLVPGPQPGQVLVHYRADTGPDGRWRLAFHEQDLLVAEPTAAAEPLPGEYVEIIGGLAGVRFEYLRPVAGDGAPTWGTAWEPTPQGALPAAVRIWILPGPGEVPVGTVARLQAAARE